MRVLLLPVALATVCVSSLAAQGPAAKPAAATALKWGPAPDAFPAGAKMAVVSGDPSKAAMFSIELAMPDGYKISPHFHPTDETVEVKSGTFLYAMGDTFDAAQLKTMAPGGKGTIPAQMHHYATAKGATVVQVTAMGPFALTYVNPADDPRQAKPKM
jgi:hypothetical protein